MHKYQLVGGPLCGVEIGVDLLQLRAPTRFIFGYVAQRCWKGNTMQWIPIVGKPTSDIAPIAHYTQDIRKPGCYVFKGIITKAQAELV